MLSGALLQRHFAVVYDSMVRFWPPPTPLLSIAPLRDCWFAVDALAPRESGLQQRGLLSVRISFSFARCFSFTCSAEMSVSLTIVVCIAVSSGFATLSAAIARLVLTNLSWHTVIFLQLLLFFFWLTLTWLRASTQQRSTGLHVWWSLHALYLFWHRFLGCCSRLFIVSLLYVDWVC